MHNFAACEKREKKNPIVINGAYSPRGNDVSGDRPFLIKTGQSATSDRTESVFRIRFADTRVISLAGR